ncbi:YdiU family protein [Vogesella sp. GCM10023246]|uniref:Protein nucleotidyltransferase YdiU n=1 Tax=Vogesella oryzagri TaxID=3160864 RepID=A0ABV1M5C6_9NEIS
MPTIAFDNSYARDLPQHATPWQPAAPRAPSLLYWNAALAQELGLDTTALAAETLAAQFSGAQLPDGAQPVAQAYAGHQFGGFSPSLGDGRALLLGEVIDRRGQRRDIAFKGSGRTPFSRRGDGKAAVAPMLRELIIGEALQALGIPTTRALAVVATGEEVYRETTLPGAVLTRVAASHIRVGTFQYFAARGEYEQLKALADYTIARHYPAPAAAANPYLALLQGVCAAQAQLIAQWMHVGFIHGVMNTDNMTLSGESIDFGPCAFMDDYDPDTVFSSIDSQGRYAYGNQPWIAQWNLARLAETLLPLIAPDDPASAVPAATEIVEGFAQQYLQHWRVQGYRKLALPPQDGPGLLEDWLALLAAQAADHTLAWRYLADAVAGDAARLRTQFAAPAALDGWLASWRQQLAAGGLAPDEVAAALRAANPLYIPRNHLVEEALAAASDHGDMAPTRQLLAVLAQPFNERAGLERYTQPAPAALMTGYRTFCGT